MSEYKFWTPMVNDGQSPLAYAVPELDESFDKLAAMALRIAMDSYETAPDDIKGLLENIALWQQADRHD
jgi:hypothetical protein